MTFIPLKYVCQLHVSSHECVIPYGSNLVLLYHLLLAMYLILLPVFIWIRWGNGMILLLFLGQKSLDSESLVRRHGEERSATHPGWWQKGAKIEVNIFLNSVLFSFFCFWSSWKFSSLSYFFFHLALFWDSHRYMRSLLNGSLNFLFYCWWRFGLFHLFFFFSYHK